jgi:uncharacterized protein (DUF885 family)
MRCLRALCFLLLTIPLFARVQSAPRINFDVWVDRFTEQFMRFNTDAAATRRYFRASDPDFEDRIERQIAPPTAAQREAKYALVKRGLDELESFNLAELTEAQRTAAAIIRWDLKNQLDGRPFDDYQFPLGPNGANSNLVSLLTVNHPLVTARDAENYIVRLSLLGTRMDESIAESRRIAGKKLLPPRFLLEAAASQIRTFLAMPPEKSPLVTVLAERTAQMKDLPGSRGAELLATAKQITTSQVYPAWSRALVLIETLIPQATMDAGLWRFPDGAEGYAYALRRATTTSRSADEIHALGLKMVSEIEGRMDTVLRQLGYTDGTVRARMDKVRADQPEFPNTQEGRAQYGAYISELVGEAERRASTLFDRVPKMRVIARPYPEFLGARAPSYSLGTTDGSRPGVYQYPVVDVPLTKFGLRTVVYHEAVPGHHFQGALQAEDNSLPRFLQDRVFGNNNAIGEGWGLYAERIAAEEGWYEGEPVGLLGQLDGAMFRARRLVVDTGLHAKRWTREQAINYLGPNPAGSAVAEVDRYIGNPGQACSYMIGELKIVELRERAKKELGTKFSLRQFHNRVLGAGRVPLDILDAEISRWIASQANN